MANTIQKRIKFSKGQIVPELVERTDLELFDSSAQVMRNVVSSVYGGVRSRRGTKKVDRILSGYSNVTGTATSSMGGTASYIQDRNARFVTDKVGSNRNIFTLQYGTQQTGGVLKVRGIKIDFESPDITAGIATGTKKTTSISVHGSHSYSYTYKYYNSVVINKPGVGLTSADQIMPNPNDSSKWKIYGSRSTSLVTSYPSFSWTLDSKGAVSAISITNGGGMKDGSPYTNLIFKRNSPQRSYSASVYISSDGVDWSLVGTKMLSEISQDFDFQLSGSFYYVKMDLDPTDDDIATTISMQYVSLYSGSYVKQKAKLVDFLYNMSYKYVLLLTNEHIDVYKDEMVIASISASDLLTSVFDDLKWTYKDDTIIFTHKDMKPKILKRVSDSSWTWSNLDLKNIPYTAFAGETTTPKTTGITPSAEEGAIKMTADSSIFDSSWVGQYIDGNGGRMKITEYVSGTVVNGYTTIPFYTNSKITSWDYISGYTPVWGLENPSDPNSTDHGYPRTCVFAQQRLWFGGSRDKPSTVWASRLGDYFNFKNSGNYDNDSIDVDLLTNDVIVNMVDNRGIHILTTGQEITGQEGTYTPDKISFTTNTQNGSLSRIRPVVIGGTVCFVEKNGKSLLSYVYNYEQASYLTDNMSLFTNLVQNPVSMAAEINSSKDKGDFLYMVLEDGTMLVGCVSIAQNIMSLSQFVTNGSVKDVCSVGGDTYIIVDRGIYDYIEKIEDVLTDVTTQVAVYPKPSQTLYIWEHEDDTIYTTSENPSVGDSIVDIYVDETGDTISAVSDNTITVDGIDYVKDEDYGTVDSIMYVSVLSDYDGSYVYLYDGTEVYEECEVINGKIQLAKPLNKNCYVGLAYNYHIQGNPIAINHKTNSIKKRITTAEVTCENTPKLKFCGQEKDSKDVYKFYSCTKYDNDVRYNIEGEFYPMQILSIQLNIDYEG